MKSHRLRSLCCWAIDLIDIRPVVSDQTMPIHPKKDKVAFIPQWKLHRWLLFYGCMVFTIHHLYVWWAGQNLSAMSAFAFYSISHGLISLHGLRILCRLGDYLGYLEEWKRPRDTVPEKRVQKVLGGLLFMYFLRPILPFTLSYRADKLPLSINWWCLPLVISIYSIVLDFWFYWYHRLMHEVSFLRRYHRAHHDSKSPTSLLLVYFDAEEGFLNSVVIPLLAWQTLRTIGLPMDFYEWWVCNGYVAFAEFAGHGGVRFYAPAPLPCTAVLKYWNAEIIPEDHDIHHRLGERENFNYGKQTRLWDRIFGTCHDRIECIDGNIDYENPVTLPLF
ncbi:hypothetical protein N7532_009702 [Penicillium argentinense]|uniref:Fatty acid hydroxylase domain-containing protein n=1 Tax=Penicillium argentinense TaxID=1131581 RepID=A0A9W9K2U2_9EURO|nr:uncharacterized protein N7532_009702 [Penicillium argentinense]KAJ5091018.1 hypothetical protein N7532_009702 [Penicillium argentinense]